jgi:polyphosphate kinase
MEVAFPVRDPALRKRVIDEGLKAYLADNREAWKLDAEGRWSKVKARRGTKERSAQGELLTKMAAQDEI